MCIFLLSNARGAEGSRSSDLSFTIPGFSFCLDLTTLQPQSGKKTWQTDRILRSPFKLFNHSLLKESEKKNFVAFFVKNAIRNIITAKNRKKFTRFRFSQFSRILILSCRFFFSFFIIFFIIFFQCSPFSFISRYSINFLSIIHQTFTAYIHILTLHFHTILALWCLVYFFFQACA